MCSSEESFSSAGHGLRSHCQWEEDPSEHEERRTDAIGATLSSVRVLVHVALHLTSRVCDVLPSPASPAQLPPFCSIMAKTKTTNAVAEKPQWSTVVSDGVLAFLTLYSVLLLWREGTFDTAVSAPRDVIPSRKLMRNLPW
jgi:hypothetical protein